MPIATDTKTRNGIIIITIRNWSWEIPALNLGSGNGQLNEGDLMLHSDITVEFAGVTLHYATPASSDTLSNS